MTKEDQAAFLEWKRKMAGDTTILIRPLSGPSHNAWQAACDYKQKRITELEGLLGIHTPYPVWETLRVLAKASEILLKDYDYDGDGYEIIGVAILAAEKLIDGGADEYFPFRPGKPVHTSEGGGKITKPKFSCPEDTEFKEGGGDD